MTSVDDRFLDIRENDMRLYLRGRYPAGSRAVEARVLSVISENFLDCRHHLFTSDGTE